MPVDEPYVCAISGVAGAAGEEDEPPAGWVKVTLEFSRENPEWTEMLAARSAILEQQLDALPAEKRDLARPMMATVVRANFAALEQLLPKTLVEARELYVSAEHAPSLLELLGQTDE